MLEVCPVSNVELKVFDGYDSHPFPMLRAAGCKVTLSSDDPPYFWTSLKREYEVAAEHFGLDDKALAAVTRTAIEGRVRRPQDARRAAGAARQRPLKAFRQNCVSPQRAVSRSEFRPLGCRASRNREQTT